MPRSRPTLRLARPLLCAALLAEVLAAAAVGESDSRDEFFERLASLCGSTFEGYSSFPPDPDHAFAGKLLVATVASCTENEIRIPFAVGEDRSRTWVLTRSDQELSLKHDHRHEDGTPDEITMYGGWATDGGSAVSQSFAADDHTRALLPAAATNVWSLSLAPDGSSLTYYLERHSEPRFRASLALEAADSSGEVEGGDPGERSCRVDSPSFSEEGQASHYADSLAGEPTAAGEPYDPLQLTAAHRTLPFGTALCVTNLANGRSVEVTVNDRGPFHEARVLDVSRRAAEALDLVEPGVARVRIDVR